MMENWGHPVSYLRLSINVFYYIGIFPYRFHLNTYTNKFEIIQHPIQRVICIIIFGIGVAYHIFKVREELNGIKIDESPLSYFKLANMVSGSLFVLTVFISLWCRSKQFLNALNKLQNLSYGFQSKRGKKALYLTPIILSTLIITPIALVFHYVHKSNWDWMEMVKFSKSRGIDILFLSYFSESFAQNTFLTVLFMTIDFIFYTSYMLLFSFGGLVLLNCVFCMGDLVDEFGEIIKQSDPTHLKVLDYYESLRQATNSLNSAVGVSIFGEVLASLPYFVCNFVDFIQPNNIFSFTLHLIEFGSTFGFIVLAANVHRKATAIEEWILEQQNLSHLSYHEITILLHNISSGSICFNGSGFFQITSGFLGSFVSLLLTFSVILIQFKGNKTNVVLSIDT